MARHSRKQSDIGFSAISVVGGLISPDKIAQIAASAPDAKTAESYSCPKGTNLRDEIARYFRIGQAEWQSYSRIDAPTFQQTATFAKSILHEVFGFEELKGPKTHTDDGHSFTIALEAKDGRVPVVVAPPSSEDGQDAFKIAYAELGDNSGGRAKRRPDALLQEWLNACDPALWGLVFAGDRLRLLRDNASFTRPAYIEADLGAIFRDEMFADFTALWLLIHATRFGNEGTPVTDCALERWREEGVESGTAARERLRENVEEALLSLGQGFLDGNPELRAKLDSGALTSQAWFEQLLRIVYRLIFLAVTEERDLLHDPEAKPGTRKLYSEGYGFAHMRERSTRRTQRDPHGDAWEGARILFRALDKGEAKLGLPPLGGIFDERLTPDLNEAKIANKHFLNVIYRLSFVQDDKTRVRINWRDMATEELGSVYEGLLELVPTRTNHGRDFTFAGGDEARGNARKTSGSYYTPDSLVQALLDSALDPVLDKAEANGGVEAILDLTVIDPACGSAHFLLGAARRMAERVAKLRDSENPDFQHALRDVVRRCIYGVDRNPMAVELAKVALWIEAVEPGKPLGFLDANIRCGDSLVGVFDLEEIRKGIPDDAFKYVKGDDKSTCKELLRKNKSEREGQGTFDFAGGSGSLPPAPPISASVLAARCMPEDTPKQIAQKVKAFQDLASDEEFSRWKHAANLYISAFLSPKALEVERHVPTTADVWRAISDDRIPISLLEVSDQIAKNLRVFHWSLEFPDVMSTGGFSAIIGNPPWEKLTLFEREFFSSHPEISLESNAAKRKKRVAELFKRDPQQKLDWENAQRAIEAQSNFMRASGRYPGTAVGDLNLYALFTELATQLSKPDGWSGLVLKSVMFTGSTWRVFTDQVITSGRLRAVYDFKNWENLFDGVGYHERFCLAALSSPNSSRPLRLAVSLTNPNQLSSPERVLEIDREFPRLVNPDSGTLPQCETPEEIETLSRVAKRFPTISNSKWDVRYSRGLDMTADAHLMVDREHLEAEGYSLVGNWFCRGSEKFAPVYEGKFIQQYNHRFATFDGIERERRFGVKAATNRPSSSEMRRLEYEILPRYWVSNNTFSNDAQKRSVSERWNLSFRHTTNVISNFRTAIGSVVGPVAFSYQCPNIVVSAGDARESALFLSVFNSVPYDYLLRIKFYGANLTKGLLMQSFIIDRDAIAPFEDLLVESVHRLTCTSDSMSGFANDLGAEIGRFDEEKERCQLQAKIDAIMFQLFGFDEVSAGRVFDTFSIWRDKQSEQFGNFLSKELTLELMRSDTPPIQHVGDVVNSGAGS